MSGDVEIFRRARARANGDEDIKAEGRDDPEYGPGLNHGLPLNPVFFFKLRHADAVDDNQQKEDIDRAVLRHPESKRRAANAKIIQGFTENNARSEGHQKPDGKKRDRQAQGRFPIGRLIGRTRSLRYLI